MTRDIVIKISGAVVPVAFVSSCSFHDQLFGTYLPRNHGCLQFCECT